MCLFACVCIEFAIIQITAFEKFILHMYHVFINDVTIKCCDWLTALCNILTKCCVFTHRLLLQFHWWMQVT